MNDGPGWGPTCWEKVTGLPPSETFKAVAEERCKKTTSDRKRKATENEKIKRKRRKRGGNSLQSRLDYSRYDGNGPNAIDILPDIPASDLHDVMLFYYSRQIKVTEAAAADITLRTNEQGGNSNSKAIWHEHRRVRVTASNVGKIAKRRPTTKVKSVVQQHLNFMEMKLQDGGQSKKMLVMSNTCCRKRQCHQTLLPLKVDW